MYRLEPSVICDGSNHVTPAVACRGKHLSLITAQGSIQPRISLREVNRSKSFSQLAAGLYAGLTHYTQTKYCPRLYGYVVQHF